MLWDKFIKERIERYSWPPLGVGSRGASKDFGGTLKFTWIRGGMRTHTFKDTSLPKTCGEMTVQWSITPYRAILPGIGQTGRTNALLWPVFMLNLCQNPTWQLNSINQPYPAQVWDSLGVYSMSHCDQDNPVPPGIPPAKASVLTTWIRCGLRPHIATPQSIS